MNALSPRVHDDGRSRLLAYDHGAHLASWEVDGRPVIWIGEHAVLDGSAAIRGGVPLCFPWFGAGPDGDLSPSHGLARTARWRPCAPGAEEVWAWELTDRDVQDRPGAEHLPGPFHARYAVRLPHRAPAGSPALELVLDLENTGGTAYPVEVALHTYLAVDDLERTRVVGLAGSGYLDKVSGRRQVQREHDLALRGETDRVFDSAGADVVLRAGRHDVQLSPAGAEQTVVWNPGPDKAATTGDLGEEEWREFVCVETAATGRHALQLRPGTPARVSCHFTLHPGIPA